MRINTFKAIVLIGCLYSIAISKPAKPEAGLILHGVDSLYIPRDIGFDFVMSSVCTTFSNNSCFHHIEFTFYDPDYIIFITEGYGVKMGKMNLDSIKTAPADSIFQKNPFGRADGIMPDSLTSRVGNCYVIKTGRDPRPSINVPFFAKIKIIKFIVVDSAAHQIKMIFLWAYNSDALRDLTTKGLDTFHLETPTINQPNDRFVKSLNRSAPNQYVFKVVGDRFVLPQELVGKIQVVGIYDLAGRKLGKITFTPSTYVIDLSRIKGNSKGIVVVKLEM
jgi:hypothetical protein